MSAQPKRVFRRAGRYQILESLGAGSTGEVYKAFDPVINRPVAVKLLRLDVLETGPVRSFIDRFYHEARIVGTLSHPHIITLFDAGQTENRLPFLAFEYADGPTVMERLSTGESFSTEESLQFLTQIAAAIDYAHGLGVIHRDIKPSNLILHRGRHVKITDFGIAKLVQAEPVHEPETTLAGGAQFTLGGSLLGTPNYMSPEQAQGLPLDGRSDQFSLAVVAFEMLTGQLPFVGSSITATLYRVVHHEPEQPADLESRGFHPERWREVFSRALAKDPAERFPTATELVDAIQCLASSGLSVSVSDLPRRAPAAAPAGPIAPTTTLPFPGGGAPPIEAAVDASRTMRRLARTRGGRVRAGALAAGVFLTAGLALWFWPRPEAIDPAVELLVPEPPGFEIAAMTEPQRPPRGRAAATDGGRRRLARSVRAPIPVSVSVTGSTTTEKPTLDVASRVVASSAPGEDVDVQPRRREGRDVRYPESAKRAGALGRVEVSFLVTENGEVRDVVVEVSTGTVLDQEVVDAVRSWKFQPARRNGFPVAIRQRYRHEFRKTS